MKILGDPTRNIHVQSVCPFSRESHVTFRHEKSILESCLLDKKNQRRAEERENPNRKFLEEDYFLVLVKTLEFLPSHFLIISWFLYWSAVIVIELDFFTPGWKQHDPKTYLVIHLTYIWGDKKARFYIFALLLCCIYFFDIWGSSTFFSSHLF